MISFLLYFVKQTEWEHHSSKLLSKKDQFVQTLNFSATNTLWCDRSTRLYNITCFVVTDHGSITGICHQNYIWLLWLCSYDNIKSKL